MTLELLATMNHASYARKAGKYTLVRVYKIDGCPPEKVIGLEYGAGVAPDEEPVPNEVPGYIEIEHLSRYCGSEGDVSDAAVVRCYAVNRDASNPQAQAGFDYTHLRVSYEGYLWQPLWWETRVLSGSERLLASIDDPPQQIGPDAEGTSVFRPRIQLVIAENVSGAELMFGGKATLIEELVDTVNEDGWNPDVTEVDLPYPEGTWLYDGADITHHSGGTFTILHKFLQIPNYCKCGFDWVGSGTGDSHSYGSGSDLCDNPRMQIYRYRPYKEDTELNDFGASAGFLNQQVRKWGEEVERKVYCIAGTDTFHDFGDLGL